MNTDFSNPVVKKEMNKLVSAKRSGLVKLSQEQLESIAEYSKWKYEQKKASLSPQKKAAIRKKVRNAHRAKKADPAKFGKTEHTALKNRAKEKNLAFDLTPSFLQDLFDSTGGLCQQTGIPFDMTLGTKKNRNPLRPSIDRISSDGGYTQDNVRVVLTLVNIAKSDFSDDVVNKVIKAWAEKI
jgi:hypothetical protein